MFCHEFSTLFDLGKIFGISAQEAGKSLNCIGLRTHAKKPSNQAYREGFAKQVVDKKGYFSDVWHTAKTVEVMREAGHKLALDIPEILAERPRLVGPFKYENHGRLYRIINADGRPVADVAGDNNVKAFIKLLNFAETVLS